MHFLLAIHYAIVLPAHESYDEPAHYAYVRFVATTGRLPQPDEIGRDGEESFQPPLYYWLAAPSVKFIDVSDNLFADFLWGPYRAMKPDARINSWWLGGTALAIRSARAASALISTLSVWLTYLTMRVALPNAKRAAFIATGLHSIWPMSIWIGGVVSNDNAIAACGSLVLFLSVCLIKTLERRPSQINKVIMCSALLSVSVFAALLSKDSGVALAGYCVALLLMRALYPKYNRKQALVAFASFSLCTLILIPIASIASQGRSNRQFEQAKTWFTSLSDRALSEVTSRPKLSSTLSAVEEKTYSTSPTTPQMPLNALSSKAWNLFQSLVGVYGRASLSIPDGWYYFCALSILFVLPGAYNLIRQRIYTGIAAHAVLLIMWIALAPLIRSIAAADFGLLTGRFLLPAYSAICIVLALCTEVMPRLARKFSQTLLLLAFGCIAIYAPTTVVAPVFAKPPIFVARFNKNVLPNPSSIIYGDTIELVGYYSPSPRAVRAGSINLFAYWRLLKPTTRNYNLRIEVFSRNNTSLELVRESPPALGSFPTSQWQLGDLYGEGFFLPIWEKTPAPTVAVFRMTWIDAETGAILPAMCIGQPCESRLGQVPIEVDAPTANHLIAENTSVARFVGVGTLLRASITRPIQRGKPMTLNIIWQADHDHIRAHKVFLHLLDSHNNPVAQMDFEPRHGDYPVEFWRKNEVIPDVIEMLLPANLTDSDYTLILGMYDSETQVRPTALDMTGKILPDGVLQIAQIHLP